MNDADLEAEYNYGYNAGAAGERLIRKRFVDRAFGIGFMFGGGFGGVMTMALLGIFK